MTQGNGVVLLVGAGDAIGAAVARRFVWAGIRSVLHAAKRQSPRIPVDEMKAEGHAVHAISVDARQAAEPYRPCFLEKIEKEIGPIEVCLYNAGSNVNKPLLDTTEKLFWQLELACYGGFLVGREAAITSARTRYHSVHRRNGKRARRKGFAAFASANLPSAPWHSPWRANFRTEEHSCRSSAGSM